MALYAVGDLQGCLKPLQCLLERVAFDPARDQLWLVGDLVNRGPQSLETLRFLFSIRHALTKLSHLHFVAHEQYASRVMRMGEAPWRITVSGAPALDQLPPMEDDHPRSGLLVTYHPVTLETDRTSEQIESLCAALDGIDEPILFTYPNSDTGHEAIINAIERFARQHPRARIEKNLGQEAYFRLMRDSRAMVGNSSSGLIEAPSFALPVVNIGTRQQGRIRAINVIDCAEDATSIRSAIQKALSETFRASLRGMINPLGDGRAAERIVQRLATVRLDDQLIRKSFYDPGSL